MYGMIFCICQRKEQWTEGDRGILPVIKTAAGAAAEGLDLDEVERIARKAERSLGTISVTFGPGYRPETVSPCTKCRADTLSSVWDLMESRGLEG